MSDVRTILERGVQGFDPGDGLDRTRRRAQRRQRNRRLSAGALAMAITVAGVAVAARQFSRTELPPPAESPRVLPDLELEADVTSPTVRWPEVLSLPFGPGENELGFESFAGEDANPIGPSAFAVAADGSFWIVDEEKNRLVHVDRAGGFLGSVSGVLDGSRVAQAPDLVLAEGDLFVLGRFGDTFVRVEEGGAIVPIRVTLDRQTVFPTSLIGTPEGLYALLEGFSGDPPIPGVHRIDVRPAGEDRAIDAIATAVDGIATIHGVRLSLETGHRLRAEATSRRGAEERRRVIDIRSASGGERFEGRGRIVELAIGPSSLAAYVEVGPDEDHEGGAWVLQLDDNLEPVGWDHVPANNIEEYFDVSQVGRHLAFGPDGSLYLMLVDLEGLHILRMTEESREDASFAPSEVQFFDEQHGIATVVVDDPSLCMDGRCGGQIRVTDDGGRTWSTTREFMGPAGSLTLVGAWGEAWAKTSKCGTEACRPILLHSGDRGLTWEVRSETRGLIDVVFTDPQHGWGTLSPLGDQEELLATSTDAGRTWSPIETPCDGEDARIDGFALMHATTGWIACSGGGLRSRTDRLYQTIDGGLSWKLLNSGTTLGGSLPEGFFGGLWLRYDGVGFLSLLGGGSYVTTDVGRSWAALPREILDLSFVNETLFARIVNDDGGSTLAESQDDGVTWREIRSFRGLR